MLYCRREDGPWILSGIETLAESCNTDTSNETIRPALFHKVDVSTEWLMVQSGLVSEVHPFTCGVGDITKAQNPGNCGNPAFRHTPDLFTNLVDESNADSTWHEMMDGVKESHPSFKNEDRGEFEANNSSYDYYDDDSERNSGSDRGLLHDIIKNIDINDIDAIFKILSVCTGMSLCVSVCLCAFLSFNMSVVL